MWATLPLSRSAHHLANLGFSWTLGRLTFGWVVITARPKEEETAYVLRSLRRSTSLNSPLYRETIRSSASRGLARSTPSTNSGISRMVLAPWQASRLQMMLPSLAFSCKVITSALLRSSLSTLLPIIRNLMVSSASHNRYVSIFHSYKFMFLPKAICRRFQIKDS